jgi:hypothetical protein
LGGLALLMLLSLLGLRATRCAAKTMRVFSCILINLLVLTWIVAAVVFAFALVGSDVCVSPGTSLLAVLNATGRGFSNGRASAAYESALFYTSTCGSIPPSGAYAELLEGQSAVMGAISALSELNASLSTNATFEVRSAAGPYVEVLAQDLGETLTGINSTLAEADCPAVFGEFLVVSTRWSGFVTHEVRGRC